MGVGLAADYDGVFEVFVEEEEQERADYIEQRKPKRLCDRALEMTRQSETAADEARIDSFFSDEKDGMKRWEAFCRLIKNGFEWRPHLFQMNFFRQCISPAVAQAVVGPDWRTYGPALCEKNGWNHIVKRAIGSGPRREGKSVIVSIVIAALAIVLRCTISVFSTGKRASHGLRDYVINNLRNSGREDRIATKGSGSERVKVYVGIYHNTFKASELNFYPANEKIATAASDGDVFAFCIVVFVVSRIGGGLHRQESKRTLLLLLHVPQPPEAGRRSSSSRPRLCGTQRFWCLDLFDSKSDFYFISFLVWYIYKYTP